MLGSIVLLKGVNDDVDSLTDLLDKMIKIKVSPYYIYHAMPLIGTEHFQLPIKKGIDIVAATGKKMPGLNKRFKYIIPHYIGKTEVIGYDHEFFYFRQHQARKTENIGRLFKVRFNEKKTWFDEDEIISI